MLSSGGVAQGHTLAPATTRSPLSTQLHLHGDGRVVLSIYETAEWTTLYLSLISSRTTFDFLPLLQCHCCHLLLLIWLKLKTEAAFISLIVSHKIASRKLKLRKSVNLKDGLNIAKYSVIWIWKKIVEWVLLLWYCTVQPSTVVRSAVQLTQCWRLLRSPHHHHCCTTLSLPRAVQLQVTTHPTTTNAEYIHCWHLTTSTMTMSDDILFWADFKMMENVSVMQIWRCLV